jgi:amino acid transporter
VNVSSQSNHDANHFHHALGFWSLTATSFGGIIGSGWLFGAFYGAQLAGPAALISWVIAGVAVALVSLVLVELGASRPEAGGSVRWPLYANGRIVGTTIGWTVVLGVLTDTEVLAVTQYLSRYWPWLYHGSSLSAGGIGIAAALEALLVVLNWYGIRLFARINLVVTWVKFIVPAITVIALFASGFHGSNLTSAGGFVLSTEIGYWSGWTSLRVAFPVTLVGVVFFFLLRAKDRPLISDIKAGAWLVAYLLVLVLFSGIGSYGGQGWIGQPWDSILVAVVSLGIYWWVVRSGAQHIEATAAADVADSPAVSDALSAVAVSAAAAPAGQAAAEALADPGAPADPEAPPAAVSGA